MLRKHKNAANFKNLQYIPTWKIQEILNSPNCTGIDGRDYGPVKHELESILFERQSKEEKLLTRFTKKLKEAVSTKLESVEVSLNQYSKIKETDIGEEGQSLLQNKRNRYWRRRTIISPNRRRLVVIKRRPSSYPTSNNPILRRGEKPCTNQHFQTCLKE